MKLRKVVDGDLVRALPELGPFLGKEVDLAVTEALPAPAKTRIPVSEFIAMRRARGSTP